MKSLLEARKRQLEARDAYEDATRAFVKVLKKERAGGATLEALATTLNVSRQYVNKLLRD